MAIYQITTKATYLAVSQLRNVAHYEFATGVASNAEIQLAINALDADYKDALQIHFPDELIFDGYDVRRVDIGDQPIVTYVPLAGTWAGTQGADVLPGQLSALVTFKAVATFPRTARSYMFPFTESNNSSGGQVSATLVTALGTWGADVLLLSAAGQPDFVKVTVRYGGVPRVVTANNVLATWNVNKEWATQRRRRKGVGV